MRLKNETFLVVLEGDSIEKSMKEHHVENGVCHGFDTLEEALSYALDHDDEFDLYVSFRGHLVNMEPSVTNAVLEEYLKAFPQTAELIDYSDVG